MTTTVKKTPLSTLMAASALVAASALIPTETPAKSKVPPAKALVVDCDLGDSINDALATGFPGSPLTIDVVGTCEENVVITLSNVTLRGAGPAASVIVGQPEVDFDDLDPVDQGPLVLNGASGVLIDNLTIREGETSGITLINSQAVITNCVIRENGPFAGVTIGAGSRAQIDSCTISDNERDGILLFGGGVAFVTNSAISNNGRDGVNAYGSAFVQIGQSVAGEAGPSTISGNVRDGVRAGGNSEADVYDSTISDNGEYGVRIFGDSRSFLDGNTIDANVTAGFEQAGVGVFENSGAELQGNQITNHLTGHGIIATNTSSVVMSGNSVSSNGSGIEFGSGVTVARSSSLQMRGGNLIEDNDSIGVSVTQNSYFQASGGVADNISSTGTSVFSATPRVAVDAFNAGYIDIRNGSTITGAVNVQVLSTLRMRNSVLNGAVTVRGNSGLGIRNDVTVTGTVTCDATVIEFSTGGLSRCP